MLPHPLTNFEIQKYQNEPTFNGVYSRDNLTEIKDGAYVTYFDSFHVEHILNEIEAFINCSLSIVLHPALRVTTIIFRIQAYDSIMCEYFCIGFIGFMLAGKTLTGFTNLFSTNNFKNNDDIILNYFMNNVLKWISVILLSMIFIKHQIYTQIYQMINNLD